ncbi:ABC transporter permease subunit [soil metagenome]
MIAFLARRLALAGITLLGISLFVFTLVHVMPGDPIMRMAGAHALDPAYHAEMMTKLGLDRPLPEQYVKYLWRAVQLDLGTSFSTQEPVWVEFSRVFPATIELSLAALFLAIVLGVPLGVWAAVRQGGWIDRTINGLAMIGASMPIFWWGLLLIIVFAIGLREWAPTFALPVAGRVALEFDITPVTGFMLIDGALSDDAGAFRSALSHLLLPALVLSTVPMATFVRMTRASLLEVLGEDYVRTARAKGVAGSRIVWHHALRNALLPLLTVGGIITGSLLGGAVFTESIFSWPGMGRWLLSAISRQDYPVLQGGIMIAASLMVAVNLLVDLLYVVADPRLRT